MNYVSWGDAARFSNWLQNGQPTAAEGPGTTETGAYTLNGAITNAALMAVGRNPGAVWFIPSENEWYKAAYYKGGGLNSGYWLYPTQNDITPSNVLSATGTNNANFNANPGYTDPVNYLTSVGAFAASPGPYGTFDQGGDVWEWNETAQTATSRGRRGGAFSGGSAAVLSGTRFSAFPMGVFPNFGFRVASVPEPATVILLLSGVLLFLIWRVRQAQARRPGTR